MENYNYPNTLKAAWDKSVDYYTKGGRNVNMFFNGVELEFLRSIGTTPNEVYDFIEDFCEEGEPEWETFLLVQSVRRDYFRSAQHGKFSEKIVDMADLPAKNESVRDMEWLPRIMAKAKAKLRGEMPTTLMYCCGGDRNFLKSHDIHPADFLRAAWAFEEDDESLIDWVASHTRRVEAG